MTRPVPAPSRLIDLADVPALADLVARNRAFTTRWDPARPERFYSAAGQEDLVRRLLDSHEAGEALPHVILDHGTVVGQITLFDIRRRAQQSAAVGYWVSEDRTGRGLATAALSHLRSLAFTTLGLHRLHAETMPANVASQHVLERNGFARCGLAEQFLFVAGRWEDHYLYQALNPNPVVP